MTLVPYFTDISEELKRASARLRRDFATHRLSAGENREELVAEFLRSYLPRTFGIDTGLVLSREGKFSNQADLLVVDQAWNAPLYPTGPNKIWLAESVYSLLEVKTTLGPGEIADAVDKCKRFKALRREFDELLPPRVAQSVFVLWAFDAPSIETLSANLHAALKDVSNAERPDFVVVPGHSITTSGQYRELSYWGLPNSDFRMQLQKEHGGDLPPFVPIEMLATEDSLIIWLTWFTQWLKGAGSRSAPLFGYLPQDTPLANRV